MGPRRVVLYCLYLLNEPVTLVWTLQTDLKAAQIESTANRALVARSSKENWMESCFSALWCWVWKCTMRCLHCKRAKSQIKSGLICLCCLMSHLSHFRFPAVVFNLFQASQKKLRLVRSETWRCFVCKWSGGPFSVCPPYIKRIDSLNVDVTEVSQWNVQILHCFPASIEGFGTRASGIRAPSSRVRYKMFGLQNWQNYCHI